MAGLRKAESAGGRGIWDWGEEEEVEKEEEEAKVEEEDGKEWRRRRTGGEGRWIRSRGAKVEGGGTPP